MNTAAPRAGEGTIAKALDVLDLVAQLERPVRFSELLALSPHPKATLYRLVQNLTALGMLKYDTDRQTYAPVYALYAWPMRLGGKVRLLQLRARLLTH